MFELTACRPNHAHARKFRRSTKIRHNPQSMKLGHFMCNISVPVLTILKKTSEINLLHHPFILAWEKEYLQR